MITIIDVSGSISQDEIETAQKLCMVMGEHDEVVYWSPHQVGNPTIPPVREFFLEDIVTRAKTQGHHVRLITDGWLSLQDFLVPVDEYVIYDRYQGVFSQADKVLTRGKTITYIPVEEHA